MRRYFYYWLELANSNNVGPGRHLKNKWITRFQAAVILCQPFTYFICCNPDNIVTSSIIIRWPTEDFNADKSFLQLFSRLMLQEMVD